MSKIIKDYWFIFGILIVFAATLADSSETLSTIGRWFKEHHAPEVAIFFTFLFSGLILNADQIKSGLMDIQGILISLVIIFLVSPFIAVFFGIAPLNTGIKIGMFLVAVMPPTLSSGVVMTGAAGGNIAHALLITIIANSLAVITIPIALPALLNLVGGTAVVSINKLAIMLKMALFVVLPLAIGLFIKLEATAFFKRYEKILQKTNQSFILGMVWMGLSQSKSTILNGGELVALIILVVVIFHGSLLIAAGISLRLFKLRQGRRESVIFMGGQKTLPLSMLLQVTLFPQYGLALVVCVAHHISHLIMDAYLVGKLKGS